MPSGCLQMTNARPVVSIGATRPRTPERDSVVPGLAILAGSSLISAYSGRTRVGMDATSGFVWSVVRCVALHFL
jgi:hypothetical protein